MTPENFCYWLQGFIELQEDQPFLSKAQTAVVCDHLKLVFDKQTPEFTIATSGTGSHNIGGQEFIC